MRKIVERLREEIVQITQENRDSDIRADFKAVNAVIAKFAGVPNDRVMARLISRPSGNRRLVFFVDDVPLARAQELWAATSTGTPPQAHEIPPFWLEGVELETLIN
jgi:hypothetical protein